MCIIIDINTLGPVFESTNVQHHDFLPVYDWIFNGKGKIIYGGTKYIEELSRTKYLNLFVQYRNARKAIPIDCQSVDSETKRVSGIIKEKNFNDQHLVGLLIASRCYLICSLDKKSYRYLTDTRFYLKPNRKPKIYSSRRNLSLLVDENIAEICKPCNKTTKVQKNIINT